MEFLKVYEVENDFYSQCGYSKVFIQEDVWDFHVFRILKNDDIVIVEMDNIEKLDIAEHLGLSIYKDVRGLFRTIDSKKVCSAVVEIDTNKGCETWDSEECSSLDEAIETVLEGIYELEKIS
jgi:hypothetical protein